MRKSAIGYQVLTHNLNDEEIINEDLRVTKNEIMEVFIELLDDWVDLELDGFKKDGGSILFNEHVDHVDG